MKRILALIMALLTIASLTSCGKQLDLNKIPNILPGNGISSGNHENDTEEEKWVEVEETRKEVYGDNLDKEYTVYKIFKTYDSDGKLIWSDKEESGFNRRTFYSRTYDDKEVMIHRVAICISFHDNSFYSVKPTHTYNTYTYDDNGNALTYYDGSSSFEYSYDTNGNLTHSVEVTEKGITIETTYTYEKNVLTYKQVEDETSLTKYSYNSKGNLVAVDFDRKDGRAYRHAKYDDGIIQMEDVKEAYWPEGTTRHKEYDEKGNLVSSVASPEGMREEWERQYDANGNVLQEKVTISGYTGDNAGGNGTQIYEYTYDEQGRKLTYLATMHTGDYEGIYATSCWTYAEDGHSYILDTTSDFNYADGVTVPHVITEYKYKPLSECKPAAELYSVYRSEYGDSVTVYKTQVENDYIMIQDHPDSVEQYWYVNSTHAYRLDWLDETYDYDLNPGVLIEFDDSELVIKYRDDYEENYLRIKN